MKIGELKHNHSLTDLLKVLLFALLMLAPIGSVLTRSLYVICNRNAYQSYSGVNGYQIQYRFETNEVNNVDDIEVGNIYSLNIDFDNLPSSTTTLFNCNYVVYDYYDTNGQTTKCEISCDQLNTTTFFVQFIKSTNNYLYIRDLTTQETYVQNNILNIRNLNFVYVSGLNQNIASWVQEATYNEIEGVDISNEGTLDNVFEYSVSKLATDQMFTWTANTPVFTGIQAMCTQLGITAPAIPIIIAYWLILTCVYIVIDIVIKIITYITHLIGARKGA